MSNKLDALIAEAKSDREPQGSRDWDAMEARLMKEVASAPKPVAKKRNPLTDPEWRLKYMRPATVVLTLAATFIVYVRRDAALKNPPAPQPNTHEVAVRHREEASSVKSGDLRIDDQPAPAGHVVRNGDALSVVSGRAVLERGKAFSWLMESEDDKAAAARVSQAGDANGTPMVLDLEHGAIEAQVTPIASGEAFAVDVISRTQIVRVAVHGTHLRVARAGDRIIVDLSEGTIAIGQSPAHGVTTGTSVTAPAHVELDANDLGTLKVDHLGVRAPVQLGEHVVVMAPPPAVSVGSAAPSIAVAKPSKIEAPKPTASGRDIVLAAIRQCASKHASSNGEVKVTITSDLALTIGPDGKPTGVAKFSPPLPPDVQSCAAETIYKTQFDETGAVAIPIELSY